MSNKNILLIISDDRINKKLITKELFKVTDDSEELSRYALVNKYYTADIDLHYLNPTQFKEQLEKEDSIIQSAVSIVFCYDFSTKGLHKIHDILKDDVLEKIDTLDTSLLLALGKETPVYTDLLVLHSRDLSITHGLEWVFHKYDTGVVYGDDEVEFDTSTESECEVFELEKEELGGLPRVVDALLCCSWPQMGAGEGEVTQTGGSLTAEDKERVKLSCDDVGDDGVGVGEGDDFQDDLDTLCDLNTLAIALDKDAVANGEAPVKSSEEASLDSFEELLQKAQSIRSRAGMKGIDESERRNEAARVAMEMAKAFGLFDDDEDFNLDDLLNM